MPDGILVWAYWLIGLSLVTCLSVYIVRNYGAYAFAALTAFYIITSQPRRFLPPG